MLENACWKLSTIPIPNPSEVLKTHDDDDSLVLKFMNEGMRMIVVVPFNSFLFLVMIITKREKLREPREMLTVNVNVWI